VDSEIGLWLSLILGLAVTAMVFVFLIERERRKPVAPQREETRKPMGFSSQRTITAELSNEARDKLRILDLEREILSYAIRRLYEANAEGKITEEERDKLTLKYKEDLARIKEEIARGESIVALNELESMQEQLVKLFSERFDEMNRRIEQIRTLSGFAVSKPEAIGEQGRPEELEEAVAEEKKQEEPEATKEPVEEASPRTERKVSKQKPPTEPEKTEAEKKVEQLLAEVDKVIKKLGQMEVEE